MNLDDLHVAVVGAATGGAATALLLARAGARVTVLEKVAEPRAVGAGIALAANGLAVLESLGVGAALAAAGRAIDELRVVDGRGRRMLAVRSDPGGLVLRRSTLQGVLLDALAAEPRIEARFGAEVNAARADGTVTFRQAGVEHTFAADLVVGADGVHSRVRAGGDFGARVRGPGITYVRALVDGVVAHCDEAWTAAGLFGSFPVDDGVYVYASAGTSACRRALAARDLDAFRAAWTAAYPAAAPLLAGVARFDDLLVNRVVRVDCRRWHDGRVVLLGDAAHAMPPNLGQGANSALVDAAVLLDELRRAADVPAALAAYQARRRPAVRRVARTAARLGAAAELTHPVARWLRDRVLLPIVSRIGGDPSALVLQEPVERLLAIGRA